MGHHPAKIENPMITVCVPCYNQQHCVGRAIDSVLAQNIENIQIILADDGSEDNTPEILKGYQSKYPKKIELLLHSENRGISGNIESIYPYIRGKYVCWFAGDDEYEVEKMSEQLDFMENNLSYIACYHDVWVKEQGCDKKYRFNDTLIGQKPYSDNVVHELIRYRCFISCMSVMIRRDGSEGVKHRPEIKNCGDWLYMVELANQGKINYIDKPLGTYYRHTKNITRSDINHEYEDACYRYLERHFPYQYDHSIGVGRALLYLNFVFKYAFSRQWKRAYSLTLNLCHLIYSDITLVKPIAYKLGITMVQRINLILKTGRISR